MKRVLRRLLHRRDTPASVLDVRIRHIAASTRCAGCGTQCRWLALDDPVDGPMVHNFMTDSRQWQTAVGKPPERI